MQAEGRAPLSGDDPTVSAPPAPAEPVDQVAPARRPRVALFLAVAVLVVAVDQLTKAIVTAVLADHAPVPLLGGLLTLDYTRNPGAAFSLGTGFTVVFTAVAAAVVVVILRTARRLYSTAWAIALGALLGGALGNLVDRLARDPGFGRGHVVDWIELPHYPVFNLADASICCAAVAMVLLTFMGRNLDGTRTRRADA